MTDDVTRRPWWRWMAGMLDELGCRVVWVVDGDVCAIDQEGERCRLGPGAAPDPTDPATLGCLLALARELWGSPGLHVSPHVDVVTDKEGWAVRVPGLWFGVEATEWSALVAACDAAWGRR